MLKALPQLNGSNTYRTTDLDAARVHISTLFVPHRLDIVGRAQALDVCISRAQIEGVSLVYHRHGASVRVRPQPLRDFFLLQIPIRGEARVKVDHEEIYCSAKQAVMISPTSGVDMTFGQDCEQLIVRVEKPDLERHLAQQLGRPVGHPLEFHPAVPLTTTRTQEVMSLLRFMVLSLTNSEGICSSATARRHLASLLYSGLLTCINHNYRDELSRCTSRPRPAYLTRAERYIEENLSQAITPDDIAAAAQASTRALFAAFRIYLNTTPMRYLRERRLTRVQEALANVESQQASVTTIAMDYGFHHLGHFCAAYQQKFGELPRETLHKTPRCAPARLRAIAAPAHDCEPGGKATPRR